MRRCLIQCLVNIFITVKSVATETMYRHPRVTDVFVKRFFFLSFSRVPNALVFNSFLPFLLPPCTYVRRISYFKCLTQQESPRSSILFLVRKNAERVSLYRCMYEELFVINANLVFNIVKGHECARGSVCACKLRAYVIVLFIFIWVQRNSIYNSSLLWE